MRHLLSATVAIAAAIGMAAAQPLSNPAMGSGPVSNPAGLTDLQLGSLAQVIRDAGLPVEQIEFGNSTGLGVTINNRKVALFPTACDTKCNGLYILAPIPDQASAAQANGFNIRYNPARATIRDGALVLDRYIIADYGMTRGGLIIELLVQADMINLWWDYKQSGPTEVSFAPLFDGETGGHDGDAAPSHWDELGLSAADMRGLSLLNGKMTN
jgi:hypothetical protein